MSLVKDIFSRKTCLFVTGASQGLGRSIAKIVSSRLTKSSICFLLSRNIAALENVKQEILNTNPDISVFIVSYDQGCMNQSVFDTLLINVFDEHKLKADDFEQSILFHNCGTLGDVTKLSSQLNDVRTVQKNFDVNISGMILLNASFLKIFSASSYKRTIVNITSLSGVQPFPSCALYCAGKAARDMFMRVLAKEEPSIRVLNYAPGPCDTAMYKILSEDAADKNIRDIYQGLTKEGKVLTCDDSINKLLKIITDDKYESGAHIDYYDYNQ